VQAQLHPGGLERVAWAHGGVVGRTSRRTSVIFLTVTERSDPTRSTHLEPMELIEIQLK
jgi:hypothetical protein